MKIFYLFLCLSVPIVSAIAADTPAAKAEPTGEALVLKNMMETLFQDSRKVNSPKAEEKNASRARIEGALDWDKVATDCLGKANAKKYTGSKFQDFRNLLKEVIVKTAFSRLDKFWDGTTYTFEDFKIKGTLAAIPTKFVVKNEPFMLEYYLQKKGGKWFIYDIAYEDLKYSENISEQIEAFLKEKSFAGLMEKLKKRKAELEEDAKGTKKG